MPRRQRGRLHVGWGARDGRPHVAVLQACPGAVTLFSGGIGVDFAAAPRRGLCAELIVRVDGRRLRDHLFAPGPGEC